MPSTTSLLKTGAATRAKLQDLQDSRVAFEWQQSSKTYEDFLDYVGYLDEQSAKTSDPTKQFSYTKAITSARSGYVSNQIQRESINVIEGNQSNTGKYNNMLGLYQQAIDEGQYDLAQGLRLQLDNLSVTIQNEREAGRASGRASGAAALTAAASMQSKQIDDAMAGLDKAIGTINGVLQGEGALGRGASAQEFNQWINEYAQSPEYQKMLADRGLPPTQGTAGYFDVLATLSKVKEAIVNGAINEALTPENLQKFQELQNEIAGGTVAEIPTKSGTIKVTMQDLQDQALLQHTDQTLFRVVHGPQGDYYVRNNPTGYAWSRDAKGDYQLMPMEGQFTNKTFQSNVPSKKTPGQPAQYKDLLTVNGFAISSEDNGGQLQVVNDGRFDSLGIASGQPVDLLVDRYGNLQIVSQGKSYNLNFDTKTGKYLGTQEQKPNPITLLSDRFSNDFIASLGDLGNLPGGAIGIVDANLMGFSGGPGGTGALLQNAQTVRTGIDLQQRAEAARLAALTPPSPFLQGGSANTLLNAPANTQLQIAQPRPLPKLTLALPKAPPTLTLDTRPTRDTLTLARGGPVPTLTLGR